MVSSYWLALCFQASHVVSEVSVPFITTTAMENVTDQGVHIYMLILTSPSRGVSGPMKRNQQQQQQLAKGKPVGYLKVELGS